MISNDVSLIQSIEYIRLLDIDTFWTRKETDIIPTNSKCKTLDFMFMYTSFYEEMLKKAKNWSL